MATDNMYSNIDWAKLQQQYTDAVSAFYSNSNQKINNPLNNNGWGQAMDYWWQSVAGQLPEDNKVMLETLMDQSKVYYSISEQFTNLFSDIAKDAKGPDDWQKILFSHLENMKSMFDQFQSQSGMTSMAPGMMGMSPMNMWNQALSSIVPDETIDKLFQVPGVGLTKDLQEKTQKTMRLWNDYQLSNQKYNAAFAMLGKQALDNLGEDILAKAKSGEKISSLKEIYNMWIDANEDVFAEYAKTEEFSKLYAAQVNSLVKFKSHYNELNDELLKSLNIPTTKGMESIARQQNAIKKELRDNREDQAKLLESLEKIRIDIEQLKGNKSSVKKKTTSGNKKVQKKPQAKPAAKKSQPKPAAKKSQPKTAVKKTTPKRKTGKKSK